MFKTSSAFLIFPLLFYGRVSIIKNVRQHHTEYQPDGGISMKKISAFLLALCMFFTLFPAAAFGEEGFDAPDPDLEELLPEELLIEPAAEEEDPLPREPDPGPLPEELPELSVELEEVPLLETLEEEEAFEVKGSVYASTLSDNSDLKLTGDTTLMMDTNRTLRSISGIYNLTVQGSGKLTVNNPSGHAVEAASLTCSTALTLIAKKDGVYTGKEIKITKGPLSASVGGDGLCSRNGNITITCDAAIAAGENAIEAKDGNIYFTGSLSAANSSNSACIKAGHADDSGFTFGNISMNGGTIKVESVGDSFFSQCGSVTLSGNVTASSKNGSAVPMALR